MELPPSGTGEKVPPPLELRPPKSEAATQSIIQTEVGGPTENAFACCCRALYALHAKISTRKKYTLLI